MLDCQIEKEIFSIYLPGKCIPLLVWHSEILTLTGTKFGPKFIPLLAENHKKGTSVAQLFLKCGILVQLLVRSAENLANLMQILAFRTVKNHTLSGTHLVFKTQPLSFVFFTSGYMRAFHLETLHFGEIYTMRYIILTGLPHP